MFTQNISDMLYVIICGVRDHLKYVVYKIFKPYHSRYSRCSEKSIITGLKKALTESRYMVY